MNQASHHQAIKKHVREWAGKVYTEEENVRKKTGATL